MQGDAFDIHGLISAAWLAKPTPVAGVNYDLCGLKPFLRSRISFLLAELVPNARIYDEFFRPADEALTPSKADGAN